MSQICGKGRVNSLDYFLQFKSGIKWNKKGAPRPRKWEARREILSELRLEGEAEAYLSQALGAETDFAEEGYVAVEVNLRAERRYLEGYVAF